MRLCHASTRFYLHSHQVLYGSGSGQQSVTGYKDSDDPNDDFRIVNGFGKDPAYRGLAITCGSIIQLFHTVTKKHLHSHRDFEAPLSKNQEISCYDGENDENNWVVECDTKYWTRDSPILLKHNKTQKYLTMSSSYQYSNPIPGQLEVYCDVKSKTLATQQWIASEGAYYSIRDYL